MNLLEKEKKVEELLETIIKNSKERILYLEIPRASYEERLTSHSLRMMLTENCVGKISSFIERLKKNNDLELEVFLDETILFLEKYDPARYLGERDHIEAQSDHVFRSMSFVIEMFRSRNPKDTSLDKQIEKLEDHAYTAKLFHCRNQITQAEIVLIELTEIVFTKLGRTLPKIP